MLGLRYSHVPDGTDLRGRSLTAWLLYPGRCHLTPGRPLSVLATGKLGKPGTVTVRGDRRQSSLRQPQPPPHPIPPGLPEEWTPMATSGNGSTPALLPEGRKGRVGAAMLTQGSLRAMTGPGEHATESGQQTAPPRACGVGCGE